MMPDIGTRPFHWVLQDPATLRVQVSLFSGLSMPYSGELAAQAVVMGLTAQCYPVLSVALEVKPMFLHLNQTPTEFLHSLPSRSDPYFGAFPHG